MAAHQVEGYRITTPVYEGPLDLLLQLIERAELDITSLALAQVTDQYLAHLRAMQAADQDAAEVSGFLVIAARLLQIKSAALLPRPSLDAPPVEEEDSAEALARQLVVYKRFKEIAATLGQREASGLRTYLRVAPPVIKVEGRLDLTGLTLQDLVQAARDTLLSKPPLPALSQVVPAPRVTIREKIRVMIDILRRQGQARFAFFLKQRKDRLEVIVTFLALLELIKRRIVDATQHELFGDIELKSTGDWDEANRNSAEDAQLEFIE